jgi:predicted membrane-bound spermidine synthase
MRNVIKTSVTLSWPFIFLPRLGMVRVISMSVKFSGTFYFLHFLLIFPKVKGIIN